MSPARRWAAAALALTALTPAACSTGAAGGEGGDGRLDVLASSPPLQHVAEVVGGEHVDVTGLVPPGGDSHDVELTAAQVGALGEADLLVHQSGLQPSTDDALEVSPPGRVVDTAGLADLDADPHFWLDPLRLAEAGELVADALAELDPAAAADYAAGAEALAEQAAALDAEHARALAPCRGATLVTSHEAFGYLAGRYGLRQVGIAGIDPHVEPTPARVRRVVDVVRDAGVRTVFFEVSTSPEVTEALARELGVGTGVLNPIERAGEDEDYPSLVRRNLDALTSGLVCDGPPGAGEPSNS
ncbi:metal ABC transporter substrate-binding protein [Paenibacillus sp. TRM 82003]|uniref:metal ABC transporter substrate-binding protein n=1 Tax=Kineococcus sp. TRM81007 TaxID=2925831 RepID=UPI001F591FBE|nr:metal ABC transporter substrate-binding protein [Kineococcus sp. TRM81007]MCI2239845.1 metal ABC transporter substrate-binding protein [Kineococcus sp. TRM81007]MCI3925852.1 metal ABC transporter substrate-binding protein [Paenibacillus sp. TRM 82003]